MKKPRRFKAAGIAAAGILLVLFLAASAGLNSPPPGNEAAGNEDGGIKLVIGAADANDAFYSAAGALSTFFESRQGETSLDIRIQVSPGSVYNTESVIAGDMDIALVQSAVQSAAVNGRGPWGKRPPQKSLRSICSLFAGALMLMAPDDSPIETLQDLAGKRVGVNIPGSGTNMNARDLLDFPGHAEWARRVIREEASTPEAIPMMREGKLDAVFINSGHPAEAVVRLIREAGRPLRFVPIDNVQSFMRQFPAYVDHYIRVASYPGVKNKADVKTIGTPTTLVTTGAMPEAEGYRLAKTIYEGFEDLRALHPVFADINRSSILAGLAAPLHSGCERFFREAGALRSSTAPAIKDATVILASEPAKTVYHQLSASLAARVNRNRQTHGVRIFVSSTSGSIENVNLVTSGQASFGVSTGQALFNAVRAQGAWSGTVSQRKLRALARVGSNSYFLVVAEDAIENGRLLPGARISVGLPGSGEEAMAELILAEISGSETAELVKIDAIEGRKRMAAREIDAILFLLFHEAAAPPASIGPQLSESVHFSDRPLRLLSLSPPANRAASSTFYQTTVTLPPTEPGGGERTVFSLTTPVILFTSVDVPEQVVGTVCESLLERAEGGAEAHFEAMDAAYPDSSERYSPAGWRDAFSGLPIAMHASMGKLIRERRGVDIDIGPSPYENYLVFGSGPPDSDFAQAAGALAAVINHGKEPGQPLLIIKPPRRGDDDNIDRILRGELALGLSERINAIDAFNGRGRWSGRANQGIRHLGTAYISSLAVLVNDNEASKAFLSTADLNGQRVSLPAGRNRKRDNAVSIFSDSRVFEGIGNHTLLSANEPGGFGPGMDLLGREAVKALVFASGSHPNKDVKRILGDRPLRPLPVTGIYSLLMHDKGYTMTGIPAGAYGAAGPGDKSYVPDIPTLGIPVDLLTTADFPEPEAYRIAWKLANGLKEAGRIFPGFENIGRDMLPGDSPIPLHEGARRAYLDAGLIVDEENRRVQDVVMIAVDPYCDGLRQADRLSGAIARTPLSRMFRGHAEVSNGIDLSLQFLRDGYAEFGIFPSVLFFDPEMAPRLGNLRSVAWFGGERFVCVTGAGSAINSFADLSGKRIGLPDGHSLEEASFDALCRILKSNNPPGKTVITHNNFMTALVEGRVDAAILTVDRLETWLDAINMTPASKRIRYVDLQQGFAKDAGAQLAAMMTGVGGHSFEISGDKPFETPVYYVPNVMVAAEGMTGRQVGRMAWMLDPDNADFGLSLAAPGRPDAPGMRPALWRNLPIPLHADVENYLRGKEDGEISARNPEKLLR
jgi:TRAP transporter TAXI family solute receptor